MLVVIGESLSRAEADAGPPADRLVSSAQIIFVDRVGIQQRVGNYRPKADARAKLRGEQQVVQAKLA